VGNPGKILRDVNEEMIQWKTKGTQLYQQLPSDMLQSWTLCEPLRGATGNRPAGDKTYKPWKNQ